MVNGAVTTLTEPDGTPVCNVAFDLSAAQLAAASHALGEVLLERHRGAVLDVDGVLALRELTGVRDELDHLAAGEGHARVLMPLGRFITLHDAVDEYVMTRTGSDRLRVADDEALPFTGALLGPMAALREDALAAALGAGDRA